MIRVQSGDFDVGAELEQLRRDNNGRAGAMVSFTGLVRDINAGDSVSEMTLEHYPGMTEKALEKIEQQANTRWELTASLIIHRVGALQPDDNIVLVEQLRELGFLAGNVLTDKTIFKIQPDQLLVAADNTQLGDRCVFVETNKA